MKKAIILFALFTFFASCDVKKSTDEKVVYQCPMKCEGEKTQINAGSCKICKMDLRAISKKPENNNVISDSSIFNLTSKWHTEEGKEIVLEDLKGKPLVMVMIYTTCKAACPRLVADMRNIEAQIPKNKDLNYVLVSIDPENDTPKRLKEFAIENKMDAEHWTFLQGTVSSVREFANVLAVKYKQITPIDFSHSNIISVFDANGELVHQQEGLGVNNKNTIAKILELTGTH